LKLVEQLHEQARTELNQQIHERTQEKVETTSHIVELTTKFVRQISRFFFIIKFSFHRQQLKTK
jgi:hypothetical protein